MDSLISSVLIATEGLCRWRNMCRWPNFFIMPPLGGISILSSLADEMPLSATTLSSDEQESVEGAGEDITPLLFSDNKVPTASASRLLPMNGLSKIWNKKLCKHYCYCLIATLTPVEMVCSVIFMLKLKGNCCTHFTTQPNYIYTYPKKLHNAKLKW